MLHGKARSARPVEDKDVTGSVGMAAQDGRPQGSRTRNLVTVVSLAILVGIEVFGLALAAGWAIAGLFELGDYVSYALMLAFSVLAAYGMVNLMRRVLKVEHIGGR